MKPILLDTNMVRALLDGHKSVTRRVVKPQPDFTPMKTFGRSYRISDKVVVNEPYRPGDTLYVRETWAIIGTDGTHHRYGYKADNERLVPLWRPSIHMPKEAARLFLRVTGVQVERVRDITKAQAQAEGFVSRAEFLKAFLKMYPDCTEDSWVWVIEFERIRKEEALRNDRRRSNLCLRRK